MLINNISFRTAMGGQLTGTFGFHVEFTGEAAAENTEIAEAISAIHRHALGKFPLKLVLLTGEFTNENAFDILTIVASLKGSKYAVGVLCDGSRYHQWFKDLDYIIVETATPRWIGFEITELWYVIADEMPEAFSFPDMKTLPMMFVKPVGGVDGETVLDFIKHSSLPWRLWTEPQMEVIEPVAVTPR